MKSPIAACIVGAGPHAQALIDHRAPLGRLRVVAFASGSEGDPVSDLAAAVGAPVRPWQEVAADPQLPVLLAFGQAATRAKVVATGLAAGKTVLCPVPAARTQEELAEIADAQQRGGGRLLVVAEIAFSEPGQRALATLQAQEFGALRSIYLAIRQPRGGTGDVIEEIGWEALDFLERALPRAFSRARVNAGALFGSARDTAILLLRSETDVVATVELARCLPPSLPAPGLGEVEIEVMGANQSLRAVPLTSAVQIHRDEGLRLAPWIDAPVLSMLRALETALDAPGELEDGILRARRAVALMDAIRATAG
jgi:predicted dehydrogenase